MLCFSLTGLMETRFGKIQTKTESPTVRPIQSNRKMNETQMVTKVIEFQMKAASVCCNQIWAAAGVKSQSCDLRSQSETVVSACCPLQMSHLTTASTLNSVCLESRFIQGFALLWGCVFPPADDDRVVFWRRRVLFTILNKPLWICVYLSAITIRPLRID